MTKQINKSIVHAFQHNGVEYTIQSNGNSILDVHDPDDLILIVDHNCVIHVFEGRYGNLSHFGDQFELFKTPISTRVPTGTSSFVEAIQFVTEQYLNDRAKGAISHD